MLPLPNLDDQTFSQIVDNAKKLIPRIYPEWNDENYHDPGITLIELFAWLKEMQQYYLDQVTPRNEMKFLKLLGTELRKKACAVTQIGFSGVRSKVFLPEGTRLQTDGSVFETTDRILLHEAEIGNIKVFSGNRYVNVFSEYDSYHVQFFAFGDNPSAGDALYIGLNASLPEDVDIPMYIDIFDEYPVARNKISASREDYKPDGIFWEYCSDYNGRTHWLPLDIIKDETCDLRQSGRIIFRVRGDMRKSGIIRGQKAYYWVRATLRKPGCEESPKIKGIRFNTVEALHRNTLSRCYSFSGSGMPDQRFSLHSYLSLFGQVSVQVRENGCWRYWHNAASYSGPEERVFKKTVDYDGCECIISFGDGKNGAIPPEGKDNIRVICSEPAFYNESVLGGGNGYPNQRFKIKWSNLIPEELVIQLGIRDEDGEMVWEDWVFTEDLDSSPPDGKVFSLITESGEIVFGDNEHGMLPYKGEGNIRIISCATGGGVDGNIKAGRITGIQWPAGLPNGGLAGVKAENFVHARGGAEAETLAEAKHRIKTGLVLPKRAVTAEDYERIACETPGLRVAKAKAIPSYSPGLRNYPQEKSEGCVTVAVVSYSLKEKPMPDRDFLRKVKEHIDKHRLVTTRVFTVPPEYIEINIYANVAVKDGFSNIEQIIREELEKLLRPLDISGGIGGWEFGRPVYKKDLFSLLDRLECVQYVEQLTLSARGSGFEKTPGGDIIIAPYGLVCLGSCEINVI